MSGFIHQIRTLTVTILTLTYCSISPAVLAVGSGKSAPWVGKTLYGKECRGTKIPFGPYDYLQRDKFKGQLFVVEEYHFTPEIQNLQQSTATSAINDIQYTLMAWPNHHEALHVAYKYRLQHKAEWRYDISAASPAECHLQRAMNFSPNDPIPYMLHGLLMHKFKRYEEALKSFRAANRLLPNDVITQYNLGLALVALKKYKEAEEVAKKVYSADFPMPGLRNKLIAAGHWKSARKALPAKAKAKATDAAPDAVAPKEALPELTDAQVAELQKAMRESAVQKQAAPQELTDAQAAELQKAMRESAAQKQAAAQEPAPKESTTTGDEGVDPSAIGQ